MTAPLTSPAFGTYAADDVTWLLKDLSHLQLEADVTQREHRIQSGQAHYAESLPIEYQPQPEYRELFDKVLQSTAERLATAVGVVTELVLSERGRDITLASLARAGTPIGILMRRWASRHGLDLPHYTISIVRGRGIDTNALSYIAYHHDPASVVFIDGWTGKGAIATELAVAVANYAAAGGPVFNPELAVLADPGNCVRTYGTREDFLIASACLNSTVSGLVSRTVLNDSVIAPGEFHGAKFYRNLIHDDVSTTLINAVTARFDDVADTVQAEAELLAGADRTPTWSGRESVQHIKAHYGIRSTNFVKPGVGETTRVLLRRVPWKILVRDLHCSDHAHIRLLAADRGVPVEEVPDLAYACMGLIREVDQ